MGISYGAVLGFAQHLAPTWRKTQHVNLALLLAALLDRPALCLSDLARAYPSPSQPLHGRLKRLMRFLDNPHLDEGALFVRWLKLAYRLGDDLPTQDNERPILPVLPDTTYFEPFALLIATVPCGSRGLPVALTTYHRSELNACFPPQTCWPHPKDDPSPPLPRRSHRNPPAASISTAFLSQNYIEEELIDYVFSLMSDALRGVLVADRGFARASLLQRLHAQQRDFDIRMDAQTHIRIPSPLGDDRPAQGLPSDVLGLCPGQRLWYPEAWYGKEEQVPIKLLAVWDEGQKEPWYLASTLQRPEDIETLYRWRMRLECANRDEKTGVLLRESGDNHALKSLTHVHRLMLALAMGEWLCALTGLQAWKDLPVLQSEDTPGRSTASLPQESTSVSPYEQASAEPLTPESPAVSVIPTTTSNGPKGSHEMPEQGPSQPPPVLPHRGQIPKLPGWMKRFAARGHLSYVRIGLEVLRAVDLGHILRRLIRWLGSYLSTWTPSWRPYQVRYRQKHWWPNSG